MRKIHISEIPYEIADNVEFLRVPICKEWSPRSLPADLGTTIASPFKIETETYRIIRRT